MVERGPARLPQPAARRKALRDEVGLRRRAILSIGLTPIAYPLLPRHLTLAAAITIGIPAFFLALAPSGGGFQTEGFLRDVARFSVPAGTAAGLGVLASYLFALTSPNMSLTRSQTVATTVLVIVGLYLILALEASGLRRGAAVSVMVAALGALYFFVLAFPPTRHFFSLSPPGFGVIVLSVIGAAVAITFLVLTDDRFIPPLRVAVWGHEIDGYPHTHPSAQFSATLRVRLDDRPGASRASRRRSPTRAARSARSTSSASSAATRCATSRSSPPTQRTSTRIVEAVRARRRASRSSTSPTAPSCCTSAARSRSSRAIAAEDARRPLDGLHAGRRARLVARSPTDPGEGLEPDDQAEHGRRRQRRHRGARARRHRPRGRAAGDGGQGGAVQGVRRRRRVPDLPRDEGRRRDRRAPCEAIAPGLRRDQPRGHLRAALLRDRARGCARRSTSRSSTTTSTARRSSSSPRCSTRSSVVGKRLEDVRVVVDRRRRGRRRRRRRCCSPPASRDIVGCDRQGALYRGRDRPRRRRRPSYAELDEPARPARLGRRGARRRRRLHRPLRPGRRQRRRRSARWPTARSSSRWRTRRPRSMPEEIEGDVAVIATGRSDYPNQINNVLAFPGIFRGALDVRARDDHRGDEARRRARRSPRSSSPTSSRPTTSIPSVFNRDVAPAVATAVADAARRAGVARRG